MGDLKTHLHVETSTVPEKSSMWEKECAPSVSVLLDWKGGGWIAILYAGLMWDVLLSEENISERHHEGQNNGRSELNGS